MRLTDGKGADVALDSVGGPIPEAALKALSPGGRVIQIMISAILRVRPPDAAR